MEKDSSKEVKNEETEKVVLHERDEEATSSSEGDEKTTKNVHRKEMYGKSEEKSSLNALKDTALEYLMRKLALAPYEEKDSELPSIHTILDGFRDNKFKKIVCMAGAGISTAAGIPDFRTPGSGLYYNLAKYKLPYPHAIFEVSYLKKKPEPFFMLAKELLPGSYTPTTAHYFIKLLETKGLLLRQYTQNIDSLERMAGISNDKLIEAHGSFMTSHCVICNKEYKFEEVKQMILATTVPRCTECNGTIKPDIVFFGEQLPQRFYDNYEKDLREADLLIILGSSLVVDPFASLVQLVRDDCIRLIINKSPIGQNLGIIYDDPNNTRDIYLEGECDVVIRDLVQQLNWTEEFEALIANSKNEAASS